MKLTASPHLVLRLGKLRSIHPLTHRPVSSKYGMYVVVVIIISSIIIIVIILHVFTEYD
jgi:hypothetical protein